MNWAYDKDLSTGIKHHNYFALPSLLRNGKGSSHDSADGSFAGIIRVSSHNTDVILVAWPQRIGNSPPVPDNISDVRNCWKICNNGVRNGSKTNLGVTVAEKDCDDSVRGGTHK